MKLSFPSFLHLSPAPKASLTLFFIIFLQFAAIAQRGMITGKVIDEKTRKPISQASLTVNNRQKGTVTNNDGQFMFLQAEVRGTDSLRVSCIGYKSVTFEVLNLNSDKANNISLVPQVYDLDEVVIKPQSIAAILAEAIATTNALLPITTNLNAYYKEFAYSDGKLYKYADAAVDYTVDNSGKKTKVAMHVIASRVKKDSVTKDDNWRTQAESFIKPDKAVKSYYNLHYLDGLTKPKSEEKYNYKIEYLGKVTKISINPKPDIEDYLPNVVAYINSARHTIMKVNLGYVTHQKYTPKVNLLVLAVSIEKNIMTAIYSDNDIPLLRYCRIDMDFKVKLGNKRGVLGSVAELLVHNNKALGDDAAYAGNDMYKKSNIFRNGNQFSDDFWLKYNTILPTAEEVKVLKSEFP